MENFLLIAGSKGSGKGLIRGLLDGHLELFVSPFHEMVFDAFYQETKDIEQIRKQLSIYSNYYQLERLSYEKKRNVHLGGAMKDRGIDIEFDFYSFDKSWVKKLHEIGENWTSQKICREIYRSFNEHLHSTYLEKINTKKYFCALSGEEHSSLISFLKTFSNSKVIYIERDPLEIISSIAQRKKTPYNSRSKRMSKSKFFELFGTKRFFLSLLKFDYEAKKVSKLFPKRFLILKFKDFFDSPKEETLKIKNFLNISMSSSLKYYSNCGYEMKDNSGNSLLSKQIDIGYKGLTKSQLKNLIKNLDEAKIDLQNNLI